MDWTKDLRSRHLQVRQRLVLPVPQLKPLIGGLGIIRKQEKIGRSKRSRLIEARSLVLCILEDGLDKTKENRRRML